MLHNRGGPRGFSPRLVPLKNKRIVQPAAGHRRGDRKLPHRKSAMSCNPDSMQNGKRALSRSVSRPVSTVEVQRGSVKEFFLTFRPKYNPSGESESVEEIYERVAEFVSGMQAEIVQERCYALTTTYGEVSAAREKAYGEHNLEAEGTLCFVGEMPCEASAIAGIQVWAVQAKERPAVRPLLVEGQAVGRKFCYRDICYVSVASLGPGRDAEKGRKLENHAISMFKEANRILAAHGLKYRDVARTWIYLPKLLSWYGEFNSARRRAYRELGLMDGEKPAWLPASTGIQGDCPLGRECMMDFLAVSRREGSTLEMQMLGSPRQCEAFQYGSSFSRAVELRDEFVSRMYVSGTASIDEQGKTAHVGDLENQIRHTLLAVRELLASRNHDFSDIAHCVAFLKRPEYATAFRSVAEEEGLDHRNVIETAADICRPELLFELEAMTVKPRGQD
jgi:enamine deaminase RidA (YjgF/YER057c/UK114 family)